MSRENVEATRALLVAWNRGDLDGTLALTHPDFEFRTSGVYPGLDPSIAVTTSTGSSGGTSATLGVLDIEVHELRDSWMTALSLCAPSRARRATAWSSDGPRRTSSSLGIGS